LKTKKYFSKDDIKAMAPLEKIGLCATVNPNGLPHITFINSLMARNSSEMTFGQFVRGKSKWYMQKNPKLSFFILSPAQKRMWIGKALWTHKKSEGPELDQYKEMPMQRYNSYFPINTVHYLDLVYTTGAMRLPLFSILKNNILTRIAGRCAATGLYDRILKHYGENLFNRLTSLKFFSIAGRDGFPELIPVFDCKAADSRRLVFSPQALKNSDVHIQEGKDIAAFCLSMQLESVLVRGKFRGYRKYKGITLGLIDIEWVYNSMPPNAGQIYPETELETVTVF